MKILPIYPNAATIMFGAFMEGNLPNPLNYDLQTVLNNMVSGRVFQQTQIGGGQQSLIPATAATYQCSPYPAWTTAQGFRGKRVMPKVTFASYSTVYQDLVTSNITYSQYQLDMLFSSILLHRVASTTNATLLPCASPGANIAIPTVKTANADGTWTLAEYDFGADVIINSLASIIQSGTNNMLSNNASYLVTLQMLVGSTWTDVTSLTTNLFNTSLNSEKYFQLPATVQARKFRIVSKAVTNPFTSGISSFAIHFYGDYATGSSPRTLGKVQHAVIFPHSYGGSYSSPSFSNGLNNYSFGRYFPHYGLTVTDDIKQAAVNDVVITDATAYPGQEQAVGALTVTYKPATLEVY